HLLELFPMAAAHLELRAIVEREHVIASLQGAEFFHAIEIDNGAAMDSAKLLRIKTLLDGVDRRSNPKHLPRRVNMNIVGGSSQIVDLPDGLEEYAVLGTNDNLLRIFARNFRHGCSIARQIRIDS